jgi:glyoxylase-like metal-dependent hydrolase (beta-lactamase superfamily II)
MTEDIPFNRSLNFDYGRVDWLTPRIRRVIARNPGPFTFVGTNTYIIGVGTVSVIDPGPEDPAHLDALVTALRGETVSAILLTHTHRDHSPLARDLKRHTSAPIYAEGIHRPFRDVALGELQRLDASADTALVPDVMLEDGAVVSGPGWTLEAITTPGHTANHLAFALREDGSLFSGDHVMAWSTSIVAPPDGSMAAYMSSLRKVAARPEDVYWPGHGGAVRNAAAFASAYVKHRLMREAAILETLKAAPATIPTLVRSVYAGLDEKLQGAAALSTFAHLEDLVARDLVRADPEPTLEAVYRTV